MRAYADELTEKNSRPMNSITAQNLSKTAGRSDLCPHIYVKPANAAKSRMHFHGAATSSGNDLIMRQSRKRRKGGGGEEEEGDGNKKEPQKELDRRKLDVISKKGEIMEVQCSSRACAGLRVSRAHLTQPRARTKTGALLRGGKISAAAAAAAGRRTKSSGGLIL